jgi:hypothetical protein
MLTEVKHLPAQPLLNTEALLANERFARRFLAAAQNDVL